MNVSLLNPGKSKEGIPREEVEGALSRLLDDIEARIAENDAMGGPPQGTA